jgi:hypothetical protein
MGHECEWGMVMGGSMGEVKERILRGEEDWKYTS